jgi:hypothetical protein
VLLCSAAARRSRCERSDNQDENREGGARRHPRAPPMDYRNNPKLPAMQRGQFRMPISSDVKTMA